MTNKFKAIIKLIRVKQYIKNLLVFLPLFFSGYAFNAPLLFKVATGFLIFCLVASIVYVVNDLQDIEKDRKHPKKKLRPLASGALSKVEAYSTIAVLLVAAGILSIFTLDMASAAILVTYLVMNILYSVKLKHIPIVDVAIIGAGFYLRLIYGGFVADIELSSYILMTVLFGSLFMAFGKRRNELIRNGVNSRKVLKFYSREFLDKNMYVMVGLTIVFYALWAITAKINSQILLSTIPIMVFMLIRYSFVIEKDSSDGDPSEVLLSDKPIAMLGVVLAILLTVGVYATW